MSNHHQLALAWHMYAGDNSDRLAQNGCAQLGGSESSPLWVQGYYFPWTDNTDPIDPTLMTDSRFSQFAAYLREVKVYRCPADRSVAMINEHRAGPRLRSVAMNDNLGWPDGGIIDRFFPLPFGSLSTRQVGKVGQLGQISDPAQVILIADVNEGSLCQPFFGIYSSISIDSGSFFTLPGDFHRKGAVMSFTDGHVESRRWKDARTVNPLDEFLHAHRYVSANNADLQWLQSKSGKPQ